MLLEKEDLNPKFKNEEWLSWLSWVWVVMRAMATESSAMVLAILKSRAVVIASLAAQYV